MRQEKTDDLEILFETDASFEDLSEFDLPEETAPVAEPITPTQRPAPQPVVAAQPQPVPDSEPVPMDEEPQPVYYQPQPVYYQPQPTEIYAARGVGAIDIRAPFEERLEELGETIMSYHARLQAHLTSYRKVKSRYSARYDSYRSGRNLLAKMAVGGKTLKLYLALDPADQALASGKYHPRDVSNTAAYAEVPFMLPIRSDLAVRKAMRVIDYMMNNFQIPKKRKRRPNGSGKQAQAKQQ